MVKNDLVCSPCVISLCFDVKCQYICAFSSEKHIEVGYGTTVLCVDAG